MILGNMDTEQVYLLGSKVDGCQGTFRDILCASPFIPMWTVVQEEEERGGHRKSVVCVRNSMGMCLCMLDFQEELHAALSKQER